MLIKNKLLGIPGKLADAEKAIYQDAGILKFHAGPQDYHVRWI